MTTPTNPLRRRILTDEWSADLAEHVAKALRNGSTIAVRAVTPNPFACPHPAAGPACEPPLGREAPPSQPRNPGAPMTLNERAAKALAGRWRGGMAVFDGVGLDLGRVDIVNGRAYADGQALPHDAVPDMADPATLGAYLAVVREAWGDGYSDPGKIIAMYDERQPGWCVRDSNGLRCLAWGATEAEALVAALEAAPR